MTDGLRYRPGSGSTRQWRYALIKALSGGETDNLRGRVEDGSRLSKLSCR